jgi:hypothetical protein
MNKIHHMLKYFSKKILCLNKIHLMLKYFAVEMEQTQKDHIYLFPLVPFIWIQLPTLKKRLKRRSMHCIS